MGNFLSSNLTCNLVPCPTPLQCSRQPITFIDHSGARVTVPGIVGSTVYDVASTHKIDLGPSSLGATVENVHNERWTEDLFGEGVTTAFDHIKIPRAYQGIVGRMTKQEEMMLDQYWDEEEISAEASRLACMVKVTKEMDGMSIFIPDGLPDDCP
ncbi:hypothetical protein TrRE_jg6321 [Triparma retinervis]|uniref:Uncharacterized protein n=1 Tax=Triparma retinervis TaxID=2557542 RepID=A0A9W6ZIR4_9STRA|nr:hypothetical protein TrRE_jg6321 [Triparma retinervis]